MTPLKRLSSLFFDIFFDRLGGHITCRISKISIGSEGIFFPKAPRQKRGKPLPNAIHEHILESVHDTTHRDIRRVINKQMDVIAVL
jgi:hypothetical protein